MRLYSYRKCNRRRRGRNASSRPATRRARLRRGRRRRSRPRPASTSRSPGEPTPSTAAVQPSTVKRAMPSAALATTFSQIRMKATPTRRHDGTRGPRRRTDRRRRGRRARTRAAPPRRRLAPLRRGRTPQEAARSGDDHGHRGEDGGPGQLPARYRLQPEIDEQTVLDEVAERGRPEPERREGHEDPQAVGDDGVRSRLLRARVEARKEPIATASALRAPTPSSRGTVACVRSRSRCSATNVSRLPRAAAGRGRVDRRHRSTT